MSEDFYSDLFGGDQEGGGAPAATDDHFGAMFGDEVPKPAEPEKGRDGGLHQAAADFEALMSQPASTGDKRALLERLGWQVDQAAVMKAVAKKDPNFGFTGGTAEHRANVLQSPAFRELAGPAEDQQVEDAFGKYFQGAGSMADIGRMTDALDVTEARQLLDFAYSGAPGNPRDLSRQEAVLAARSAHAIDPIGGTDDPVKARALIAALEEVDKDFVRDNRGRLFGMNALGGAISTLTLGAVDPRRGASDELARDLEMERASRGELGAAGKLGLDIAEAGAVLAPALVSVGSLGRGLARGAARAGLNPRNAALAGNATAMGILSASQGGSFAEGATIGLLTPAVAGRIAGVLKGASPRVQLMASEVIGDVAVGGLIHGWDVDQMLIDGVLSLAITGATGKQTLLERYDKARNRLERAKTPRLQAKARADLDVVLTEIRAEGGAKAETTPEAESTSMFDTSDAALSDGVSALRGESSPTARPLGRQAGAADPAALAALPLEAAGKAKRALIDTPLGAADRGARALFKMAGRVPGVSKSLDGMARAKEVIAERVPWYRKGAEYASAQVDHKRQRALAQFDASASSKDLARIPETKDRLTPEQQDAVTSWFSGEADDAALTQATSAGYAKKARVWRERIAENQRALRDSGYLSEEVYAEWKNNWVPRLFDSIEGASKGQRSVTREGGVRIPEIHRRRSRYDIKDESGNIIASFKDGDAARGFVERIERGEALGRADRQGQIDALKDRVSDAKRGVPDEIISLRTTKRGDGADAEFVVRWETSDGRRSKTETKTFDDPERAEAFRAELADVRAGRRESLATVRELEAELARVKKGEASLKPTKLTIDEPLSKERLKELGEIRDPSILVARGLATQEATLANIRLLDSLSANQHISSAEKTDVLTEPIPDGKQYGSLAGRWVHPSVRREVVGMLGEKTWADRVGAIADSALASWKKGKVAMRPAAHGRQWLGNTLIAELDGVSFADTATWNWLNDQSPVRQAVAIMRAKPGDPLFKMKRFLIEEGVQGSDFISVEVGDLAKEVGGLPGRTWQEKTGAYLEARLGNLKRGEVFAGEAIPGVKEAGDFMGRIYQLGDVLPKTVSYVKKVQDGMSPREAAALVRSNWPQYDAAITTRTIGQKGRGMSAVRQVAPPFLTFTAEALRLGRRYAAQKPVTFAAIVAGLNAAGKALGEAGGYSEEDIEAINRAAPEHRQIGLTGWMLPSRGENGESRMLDLTYTIPLGDEYETLRNLIGGKDLLGDHPGLQSSPTGPFVWMAAQGLLNKDAFKAKPIDRSKGEGSWSATSDDQGDRDMARFLYESLFSPVLPGGRDWRVVQEAASGIPVSRDGRVRRDPLLVGLDVALGIKVNEFDPKKDRALAVRKLEGEIVKKLGRMSEMQRDKSMTPEDRDRENAELMKDVLERYNRTLYLYGRDPIFDTENLPPEIRRRIRRAMQAKPTRGNRSLGRLTGLPSADRREARNALEGRK